MLPCFIDSSSKRRWVMLIYVINSLDECASLLRHNRYHANGKNIQVSHLYATAANSPPVAYEGLWGIYLTKPNFAWMAVWMAVLSRAKVKKRQIRYLRPNVSEGDLTGRAEIYNPQQLSREEIVCQEAWLHLFDLNTANLPLLSLNSIAEAENKIKCLKTLGFALREVHKRDKTYHTYCAPDNLSRLIDLDEWQVALVNVETTAPCAIAHLIGSFIRELHQRIAFTNHPINGNYLA